MEFFVIFVLFLYVEVTIAKEQNTLHVEKLTYTDEFISG